MHYKLVAMDLDGTLLNEDHTIDPGALDAIRRAAERGVTFTIATGRMHGSAERFAAPLGIEVPLISYNGSVVRSALSGREHRHLRVPRAAAATALSLIKADKALRYAFMDDRVLTDTPHEWTDQYAKILGIEMALVDDIADALEDDPTMLVFMCEEADTSRLTGYLSCELDSAVRLTNSNPWFVDVLNADASKAMALRFLAESLGVRMRETVAIGDSWNDLEMIEAAGLGVAVANGTDRLKEWADYITTEERGRGVAEVLRTFILDD
ncbi:MAG: Cof-type HAD-IIB family hydrolase [Chloroflexi bacterium]|nr:Cof-type HAD-IIB family hydrolase [Chloroflexota bacterium]